MSTDEILRWCCLGSFVYLAFGFIAMGERSYEGMCR